MVPVWPVVPVVPVWPVVRVPKGDRVRSVMWVSKGTMVRSVRRAFVKVKLNASHPGCFLLAHDVEVQLLRVDANGFE